MEQVAATDATAPASPLPGAPVIARIRRLIVVAGLAALVYTVFTRAGKSMCFSGADPDGSFIDASGSPIAPSCVGLTLSPGPLVYFAIVLIVIGALTRALRASGADSAIRPIDRAAAIIGIAAAASVVISQVWFGLIPLSEYGNGFLLFPFPFGGVEITVTPLETAM